MFLAGIGLSIIAFGSILAFFSEKTPISQVKITTAPTPTSTPSSALITIAQPLPTQIIFPTDTPMPTPAPTAFKPGSFIYKNAELSSRFIEVAVDPGNEANAFTIKSNGAREYTISQLRIFGVDGLSLSPAQEILINGDTKQIKLRANQSSSPGRYSGFVDIKIDGDDITLFITVNVGSQPGERYIKVTSPKGGEVYKEGDTIKLIWESKDVEISGISIVSENGNVLSTGKNVTANGIEWKSEKYFDQNATHFKFYIDSNYVKGDSPFIAIN